MTEPTRIRPTPLRAFVRGLAINAAAFAVVAGFGEAVVRALPEAPASATGHYEYVPHRRFRMVAPPRGVDGVVEFDHWITSNRYGYHGPDHPPERTPGRERIAIVGDSMIEAYQVAREETLAAQLEERLEGVECLSFGRSGHSTVKQDRILGELPRLLAHDGGSGTPDLVVFSVHGSYAVRQCLTDVVRPQAFWRRAAAWSVLHVGDRSAVLALARDAVVRRLAQPTGGLLEEARRAFVPGAGSDLMEQAWGVLGESMADLAAETRAMGAVPVFVYVPDGSDLREADERWDPDRVRLRFRDLAAAVGADWIDVTEPVRAAARAGAPVLFEHDNHLTARGHAVVADALAPLLGERLGR